MALFTKVARGLDKLAGNVTGIAKNQGNASGSKEKDKRMLSPKRSNSNPNNTPNPAGMRSPNQLRSPSPRSSGGMSPGRVMSPMRTTSDSSDGMNASSSSGRGGTSSKHKSPELFNPDMYAHWGVIKRLRTIRFHKYYCGIAKNYIVFFEHDSKDFVGIYDLTGSSPGPVELGEFVIRGLKLKDAWLFRCASEQEAESWVHVFMKAAHYKADKEHEARLAERRRWYEQERERRQLAARAMQQQAWAQQEQQRLQRQRERDAVAAMDPLDYEGRLEVLLQETGLKPDQHTCVRFKDDEMTPACTRCGRFLRGKPETTGSFLSPRFLQELHFRHVEWHGYYLRVLYKDYPCALKWNRAPAPQLRSIRFGCGEFAPAKTNEHVGLHRQHWCPVPHLF